jgi:hypothetical protein
MIKIKLTNWNKGRNNQTFRAFLMYNQYFNDIGVQFVDGGSYDFEFIGMADFLNKKLPLNQSIELGIEEINKRSGDCYLFDGSDSTSLMASWEVMRQTNANALFKNQLLTHEMYGTPTAFNKWFFGNGSDLDLSYNISDEEYKSRLKLTGWNLGYYDTRYLQFDLSTEQRNLDVCAIYQALHDECYDHTVRNDTYYTNHRLSAWSVLGNSTGFTYITDKRPYNEYIDILRRSKMTISPFGMGEICFRDFEIIQFGSIMIKPDMSNVITYPNIYIPYETYIPCKLDWSDLSEKIHYVLDNYDECKEIAANARQIMQKSFTIENLLLYWYDMIKTFKGVTA